MSQMPPLRVAIVSGEESGDILAADLVRALDAHEPDAVGVARTG